MRVAVTGVGVACGAGIGAASLLEAMRNNRSLAAHIETLGGLPSCVVAAPMSIDNLPGYPDDRKVALLASALQDLQPDLTGVAPKRIGVFLGTGLSSVTPDELATDLYPFLKGDKIDREAAARDLAIRGGAPNRHLPERATAFVAQKIGAKGACGTSFSACAASAEAIAAGARAIARGEIDVAIAGGHDSMIHPFGVLSFHVLGALSETAGRPFDRARDGFVLGEGAALLKLERADGAVEPLAFLDGSGSSIDAHGVTAPHPAGRGAEASMRAALKDAGIAPGDVDWINAHATATPQGDIAEALAISRVFGDKVPTSSLKGLIGHCLAAAGAVEAVATVLAMQNGFIPAATGCRSVDDFEVDVVLSPVERQVNIAISNSFGFGGQNTTLVFGRV